MKLNAAPTQNMRCLSSSWMTGAVSAKVVKKTADKAKPHLAIKSSEQDLVNLRVK